MAGGGFCSSQTSQIATASVLVPRHCPWLGQRQGRTSNTSVIAYRAEARLVLREQVTEEAVLAVFATLGAISVKRYELPNLLP